MIFDWTKGTEIISSGIWHDVWFVTKAENVFLCSRDRHRQISCWRLGLNDSLVVVTTEQCVERHADDHMISSEGCRLHVCLSAVWSSLLVFVDLQRRLQRNDSNSGHVSDACLWISFHSVHNLCFFRPLGASWADDGWRNPFSASAGTFRGTWSVLVPDINLRVCLQARDVHSNEVVAIKKMSYSGKQTNEVTHHHTSPSLTRGSSQRHKEKYERFLCFEVSFCVKVVNS